MRSQDHDDQPKLNDTMPQCQKCQKLVAVDDQRCPHCGAWLSHATSGLVPQSGAANGDSLEEAVRSLLREGQIIGAIKLYRERTGAGLADAKQAIDRLLSGQSLDFRLPAESSTASIDLEKQLVELLSAGSSRKTEAIGNCFASKPDQVSNKPWTRWKTWPGGMGCDATSQLISLFSSSSPVSPAESPSSPSRSRRLPSRP